MRLHHWYVDKNCLFCQNLEVYYNKFHDSYFIRVDGVDYESFKILEDALIFCEKFLTKGVK